MSLDTNAASWLEVQTHLTRNTVAIFPVGAHEQHGPHLPLATDTVMATGLARRLAQALDAMLLPALPFGDAWNTAAFPGTISLSFTTVQAILMDVGQSLQADGVKALIVVNGHFGNHAPLALAARELWSTHHFPTLLLDYPGLPRLAAEICESEPAAPSFYHADEVETSIMLALWPESVKMERAQAEYPDFPPTFGAEPIRLDTFCQSGVFGDPRPATAVKGERLLAALSAESLKVAQAFLANHIPTGSSS